MPKRGAAGPPVPVLANAAEKRARALQLRIGGATYDQIAQQVGFSGRGGAYRAVAQALRDIPREAADELRQLELERFDTIQIRLMQKLGQGDLTVVPNLLRLAEQRARLLGLNKPEQLQLQAEVHVQDDQQTARQRAAIEAAVARRDAALQELNEEARVLTLTMSPVPEEPADG